MEPTIEFDGVAVVVGGRHVYDAAVTATRTDPLVVTPYPGPRARALIERMRAVEGAGPRTGGAEPPLVVESASGSILTDPDGNRFVDLAGSFAAATIGHSPSRGRGGRSATRSSGVGHVSSGVGQRGPGRVRGGARRDRAARPGPGPAGPERVGRQRHGREAGPHADRAPRGHRLLRRLSRPVQRRHRAERQVPIPRRRRDRRRTRTSCPIRTAIAGRSVRTTDAGAGALALVRARHRGPGVRDRPAGGDRRRVGPGQRRHRHPAGRVPRRPARAVRSPRHRPHLRRGPVRLRSDRADLGVPSTGTSCRT